MGHLVGSNPGGPCADRSSTQSFLLGARCVAGMWHRGQRINVVIVQACTACVAVVMRVITLTNGPAGTEGVASSHFRPGSGRRHCGRDMVTRVLLAAVSGDGVVHARTTGHVTPVFGTSVLVDRSDLLSPCAGQIGVLPHSRIRGRMLRG